MLLFFKTLSIQLKIAIGLIAIFIIYKVSKSLISGSDTKGLTVKEKRAYKAALSLKSALGTGIWWQLNSSEKDVIKIINNNSDIITLIEEQFYKITKEKLFTEITRALTSKEIALLNISSENHVSLKIELLKKGSEPSETRKIKKSVLIEHRKPLTVSIKREKPKFVFPGRNLMFKNGFNLLKRW